MRIINVLGISLTDYLLKEALEKVDIFLRNGALNTVLYLNTRLMVAAGKDESLRTWIEKADMTVLGDEETLRQSGITTRNRIHEVQEFSFLKEALNIVCRDHDSLYLVADTQQELKLLEHDIDLLHPGLFISGQGIFGDDGNINAQTINEINDIVPIMIIMRMPYQYEQRLMGDSALINSELVIGLPDDFNIGNRKESFYDRFIRRTYQKLLRRLVSEYEKDKN